MMRREARHTKNCNVTRNSGIPTMPAGECNCTPQARVILELDLSEDEFVILSLALGYAAGNDPGPQNGFVRIANKINEGNPRWHPWPKETGATDRDRRDDDGQQPKTLRH